jgi:hypothetical protein
VYSWIPTSIRKNEKNAGHRTRYTGFIDAPFGPYQFAPGPGYLPGADLHARLRSPDGADLGECAFRILRTPGSGYAGQVWQCRVSAGPLPAGSLVALKILHPRSAWKTAARDALFFLSFQAPFAPRLSEEAVHAGQAWQDLLRRAADEELGPGSVVHPLGYFWDAELASFVEVSEWIDGRPVRLEPDEELFSRAPAAPAEVRRLKRFMDRLADLCREMGADGLARQYAWFSFVSQANILVRADGSFTAVDCRPGLAFPFFLPLTPAHLAIAAAGLRRGLLAHYAEVDMDRLEQFLRQRPALVEDAGRRLERLRADEAAWRAGLPDLWNRLFHPRHAPFDRRRLISAWRQMGWIDPQAEAKASASRARFLLFFFAAACPPLLRLAANRAYRRHVAALLVSLAYRRTALAAWTGQDLPRWIAEGRLPPDASPHLYPLQKLFLASLPAPFQRLFNDPSARAKLARQVLFQPLSLLFSQAERERWLEGILLTEFERGAAEPQRAHDLLAQVHEPRLRGFIRDLGLSFGLDVFSRLVYLGLAWYGLSSGDYLPIGVALLSPIPPSGPLRFLYVLTRLILELPALLGRTLPSGHPRSRLLLARLGALLIAPLRFAGNLFPLVEISAVYPRLAFLLGEFFVSRLAAVVPVFGGRGKLLEIWVFQVCINLPLSLRRLLRRFLLQKPV